MKQLYQSYKSGEVRLAEVPVPKPGRGEVLVRNLASLISVGTERQSLELAKKSLLGKALVRPDLVRQTIDKVRTEGLAETMRIVNGRLDTPLPLGYSCAGIVQEVGDGVTSFAAGDRVACVGPGFAGHAEFVAVPVNFCSKVADNVDFTSAAFVAVGGIALHAIRVANVSIGDYVSVIGLGLIGQLATQILVSAGAHVYAMDVDEEKCALARSLGATLATTDGKALQQALTSSSTGADAVLIFASTDSHEPLRLAAEIARERAKVIAAGLVGLEIPRKPFYEKELEFIVSRGWGPGQYDPDYVQGGKDYPAGYVRWTAERNCSEFLRMLSTGRVKTQTLTSHRYSFDESLSAYELLLDEKAKYLGVVLEYPESQAPVSRLVELRSDGKSGEKLSIGMIGAGQFARSLVLPELAKIGRLRTVVTKSGVTARSVGERYRFERVATDKAEVFNDPEITTAMIFTRHGSHAVLASEALNAGKHVFIEKPVCLNESELLEVTEAYQQAQAARASAGQSPAVVMVGFNRRFAPSTQWLQSRFGSTGDTLSIHCEINAGPLPPDSWVYDESEGGGRIIGEIGHWVDLMQYFASSLPVRVYAEAGAAQQISDHVVATLKFANGATGSISYVASGDKSFPRERITIIGRGAVGVLENFTRATFTRGGRTEKMRKMGVDRGHKAQFEAFAEAIKTGRPSPVEFRSYIATTSACIALQRSALTGKPIDLSPTNI
jgi:predicted dehydrogenase